MLGSIISILIAGVIMSVLRNAGIHLGAIPTILLFMAIFGITRLFSGKTEGGKPKEAESWICPKCQTDNPGYRGKCESCGEMKPKS